MWLRERGLAHLRADDYGVWLEDGRCLRFLVHVDPGPVGGAIGERERSTAGLGAVLAGYRRTDPFVPVGAVLVIAHDAAQEANLLADLMNRPLRAPVAVTTADLLHQQRPHESVWRVSAATARHRLIEIPPAVKLCPISRR
ncbi:hypothetical protein KBX08_32435 [Micromonospora sp. H61]|nr:hypothetical protein [Micromonospora sp. H61]